MAGAKFTLQCALIFLLFLVGIFLAPLNNSAWATGAGNNVRTTEPVMIYLWHHDPYAHGLCDDCPGLIKIYPDDNPGDLFEYPFHLRSGYYTAALFGPTGTKTTLFGDINYKTDRGYLVLIKTDDDPIEVDDLEGFSPNQWVEVPHRRDASGGYKAYYSPHEFFKEQISSLKWENLFSDPITLYFKK
jgi:hypothetical protein